MKKLVYINTPELNHEHISYLEKGFFDIIKNDNCASLEAFPSDVLNKRGIFLTDEAFKQIASTFEADCNFSLVPSKFILSIRKSPISLFKRWIFCISEKPLLSISQRAYGSERDFFPLFLKNRLNIVPITTNIAHERFLLAVYSRKKLEKYTVDLHTQLSDGKKLVIYKDYAKKKISTLTFRKTLLRNKAYPINITVMRELGKIKFKVVVAKKYTAEHSIGFKKPISSSELERDLYENKRLYEENEKKVLAIMKKHDGRKMQTNNYANIALGRVARVPILITLPDRERNANISVSLHYITKTRQLEVKDVHGNIVKMVTVSTPPKSNWLKRARGT